MYAGEAWHVIVGGTGAFGGGSRLGRTDHGDDLLDVVLVERGSRLGLILRAWGMRRGTLEEQRGVVHRRARHAEIGVPPGTEFNVDGEICELRPPRVHRAAGRRTGGGRAMNKRWPAAIAAAGAAWYASESLRHRREQGARLHPRRRGARGGHAGVPARLRGAHRGRRDRGQPRRGPRQRRRDLPRLPRDHPAGRVDDQLPHLRVLAGRHRARGRRALARPRAATASTSTSCSTRSARRRWSATCSTTCATRG